MTDILSKLSKLPELSEPEPDQNENQTFSRYFLVPTFTIRTEPNPKLSEPNRTENRSSTKWIL